MEIEMFKIRNSRCGFADLAKCPICWELVHAFFDGTRVPGSRDLLAKLWRITSRANESRPNGNPYTSSLFPHAIALRQGGCIPAEIVLDPIWRFQRYLLSKWWQSTVNPGRVCRRRANQALSNSVCVEVSVDLDIALSQQENGEARGSSPCFSALWWEIGLRNGASLHVV